MSSTIEFRDSAALLSSRRDDSKRWRFFDNAIIRNSPFLLFAILGTVLAMSVTGFMVYRSARHMMTDRATENLAAVSMLKVGQIEHWLTERRDDAQLLTRSSAFTRDLRLWMDGNMQDAALKERLLRQLHEISAITQYHTIVIHSARDGSTLLSSNAAFPDTRHSQELARSAAQRRTPVFDDLHFSTETESAEIEFGYFVPFGSSAEPPEAVLHLVSLPGKVLFPLLQNFPGASPSAETLLIRGEGKNLLYLNTLRHRPNSALRFRMPANTPRLIAAQAMTGNIGPLNGVDYRNVPTLGYAQRVAGTPWILITKIDKAEVYEQLNNQALFSALATAFFLLAGTWWIIAHVRATVRIERLSRLYSAISQTNQAIIHSSSPAEIYRAVCNACVELAGLRLAWVGIADTASQRIVPVESAGIAAAYVENIVISLRPDLPEGQGPSGIAYREQKVVECADILSSRGNAPWHARAVEYGLGSSITLPLLRSGKAIGVLCVYGGEPGFFDSEAQHILGEMASNISFFLDHFDQESQRQLLLQRLVAVQEEERRQLVNELHDSTSPNLAAIQVILNTMKPMLQGHGLPTDLNDWLEDALALLEDTGQNVRQICGELRPTLLDYSGLVAALNGYAHQFSRRTGIVVNIMSDDDTARLPGEIESALFRIAQEALTNCAKHAGASLIEIEVACTTNPVSMSIADNGNGFNKAKPGSPGHPPGLGLITMRERAEYIGGNLIIDSETSLGTRITVTLPLPEPSPPALPLGARDEDTHRTG